MIEKLYIYLEKWLHDGWNGLHGGWNGLHSTHNKTLKLYLTLMAYDAGNENTRKIIFC